jgi:hypothetical protein
MTIIEEPRGLARGADPGDRGDWSEWSDWSDGSDGSDGSDAAHDQGPAAASDEVPRAAERAADAATATPAAERRARLGGGTGGHAPVRGTGHPRAVGHRAPPTASRSP